MAEADPVAPQLDGAGASPFPAQRRRRPLRWRAVPAPLRWLAYVIAALFAIWLLLFITKGRFLKHPFERLTTSMTHRPVKVAGDFQLYFAPFNIKFLADGLSIGNPAWASRDMLFSGGHIESRLHILPLFWGERRLQYLELRDAALDLEWSKDGKHNSWTLGDPHAPPGKLELPLVRRLAIAGTTIRYRDPRYQLVMDVAVDPIRGTDNRIDKAIGFNGGGRARSEAFRLTGRLLSPNETMGMGRTRIDLSADSGRTHLNLAGTLLHPTQVRDADLSLSVRGRNIRDLFDLAGVAVPDTRPYRIRSALTYDGEAWKFTALKGRFGESDVAGRMTVSFPEQRPMLKAVLATRSLDIVDIGPFIGYRVDALAAGNIQAAADGSSSGPPRILPDAPLRVDAVRRFDADVSYSVRALRAPNVPISNVSLKLVLDHGKLGLTPLQFAMAGGWVTSDIVIDARRTPVHSDADVRLSPTPMGKLLGRWGVEESGTTGVVKARVQLAGPGESVRAWLANASGRIAVILPAGKMWARNAQLAEIDIGTFIWKMFEKKLKEPVEINCGLLAFTVRDGIAAADPILIDTTKNVIVARGGFSLKAETIDLAFRADGKKFSLFSGQSPVGLGGYFSQPSLDVISPDLVARAGAGIGLGVLLSPLASVLAFVDIGDAKSAACGPVLHGANAAAQRTSNGKPRDDVGAGTTKKSEDGR